MVTSMHRTGARKREAPARSLSAADVEVTAHARMLAHVRASGLKLTPQRIAIVREIASDPTHPTAQELYERLLPSMPTMSFATVYNTLDALAVAGLCAARALSPGPSRFDPNMVPHDHAVCDSCGLVRDVAVREKGPSSRRSSLTTSISNSSATNSHASPPRATNAQPVEARALPSKESPIPGFSVHAVEQIYRGICADCDSRRRKKSSAPKKQPPRKQPSP